MRKKVVFSKKKIKKKQDFGMPEKVSIFFVELTTLVFFSSFTLIRTRIASYVTDLLA